MLAMGAGLPAGLRVQHPRPVLAGAGPDERVQLGRRGGAADPHQLPGEVHRGRLPALPHDLGSRGCVQSLGVLLGASHATDSILHGHFVYIDDNYLGVANHLL